MFSSSKSASFAALSLLSLAAIPLARSAQLPVTVGGPDLIQYNPSFVNANVGDVIVFTFMQKNHTATQSSLASPCTSLEGGFDSGFQPVAANQTGEFPVAQLTVQDTNPIWVYCRQTGHCEQGMVFAVNPGNNLAQFQAAATGNSTASSSVASTTAPAASVVTVTATVTESDQTFTTTYGSYPGSAAPTAITSSNHLVTVGANGALVFNPSNITAQPGDTVTFEFHQKNHTATQSTFAEPCLSNGGFNSGFMPVNASLTSDFPTYNITINGTTPVWVYCQQTGHCGQGMVFSVNAVEPNDFAAFQAKAMQLNGTSTSSTASSSASATSTHNGASHLTSSSSITMILAIVAGALFCL